MIEYRQRMQKIGRGSFCQKDYIHMIISYAHNTLIGLPLNIAFYLDCLLQETHLSVYFYSLCIYPLLIFLYILNSFIYFRKVFVKFAPLQIYSMRTVKYFNPKTITIDSDIFDQESPLRRSKLPLQLLKSLAQKKRVSRRNSTGGADRYSVKLSKARVGQMSDQLRSQSSLNLVSQPMRTMETSTSKEKSRRNPETGRRRGFYPTDNNQVRHNQVYFSNNEQECQLAFLRETRESFRNKIIEKNEKARQEEALLQSFIENTPAINPYTHQPYSYITHKERDQLIEIKKAQRFRRMSSITKSYKIVTLQLASPQHHRRPSVQYSPPKVFSPSKKNLLETKKQMGRRQVDVISPSPWQWGLQQSKDLLQ